jgi:simple sugar transport system permease protein
LGESPLKVVQILIEGSMGSPTQIGYSLFYATPLMLTGLSVAWAFRAGLFNIGAEGQMMIGGLMMSVVGILLPGLPWYLAVPLSLGTAFVTAGLWGAFAGWIKAKRGCHEVLATILLNFVAYGLVSFFILSVFKNPESQVPETSPVGPGYQIPAMSFIGGMSPLNWSFVISMACVLAYGFLFSRTRLGFYQKMAGGAPDVGRRAGISMDRQTILAMFIAGGIAGLAGASPVLGYAFKTREGFTAGAGFVGVAVALLGRNSPIGIILAALLFGVLTKGSLDLDLDTDKVSRDLAIVIQAFIVLAVASQKGLMDLRESFAKKGG